MKLENVKVGQILKDKFGNKFEVMTIDKSDNVQSVEVKCVEFKKSVCVSNLYINRLGDNEYLINDKSLLISLESLSGEKIVKNLNFTVLPKCFKQIKISSGYNSQTFLVAHQETIDKIDVTLSDLEDVSPDYLTSNNVKLGMTVSDGLGNEYVVVDVDNDLVQLSMNMNTATVNGKSCVIDFKTWIPFYDENNENDDVITTKDFRIIEG